MSESESPRAMTRFQKSLLWSLAILLVASVAARGAFLATRDAATAKSTLQPAGFLASTEKDSEAGEPHTGVPGAVERALPFVTEASLFGLIGFALGYASRKVFKIGLVLIALAFVGVQVLVHFGLIQIEWSRLTEWLNGFVLNLKENESITNFLTKRVPSAGSMLAGYVVGFRRA